MPEQYQPRPGRTGAIYDCGTTIDEVMRETMILE
jgi:hypothetical protein